MLAESESSKKLDVNPVKQIKIEREKLVDVPIVVKEDIAQTIISSVYRDEKIIEQEIKPSKIIVEQSDFTGKFEKQKPIYQKSMYLNIFIFKIMNQ